MSFSCITIEGGLFPPDLLEAIRNGEARGQREEHFGLPKNRKISDEIASAWNDACAYWNAFQHALNRLPEDDPATTATREQWVRPLLESLGYSQLTYMSKAAVVDGQHYAISHRAGEGEESPPIHIEGVRTGLGKKPPSGRPRLSPHSLVQEYLNRTEQLWGIATNGEKLRLLRDSSLVTRPTYVECDLKRMMEEEKFFEFILLYRLLHRSRFPKDTEDPHTCLLETYWQQGIELGGRVREKLRDGVEQALKVIGNGFLSHPKNHLLRERIQKKELPPQGYYRQLLRLIYRFLFLMVSEERKLVGPKNEEKWKIYLAHYSISRVRNLAEQYHSTSGRHSDAWEGVKTTFRLFSDPFMGQKLEIPPLNGELFSPNALPDLEQTFLYNVDILTAIRSLSLYEENRASRRVNYAALDVEELGSVYESLLDFYPQFSPDDGSYTFQLVTGTERKTTGSYYTRPELVQELIKSALVPVIEERLSSSSLTAAKEHALLSIKVCDPASGSGHFLLAAARRIARELAKIRSGEDEPSPEQFRPAVRDVIANCIYGVDLNPLAVDLCKLALWLEGHTKGKPLSFLDHKIKWGNSLIGAFSKEDLLRGIPDDAFNPVTGDERAVAQSLKRLNRQERRERENVGMGQITFQQKLQEQLAEFAKSYSAFHLILEETPEDVSRKAQAYHTLREGKDYWHNLMAAHIWTAAYFTTLAEATKAITPTHEKLTTYLHTQGGAGDRRIPGNAQVLGQTLNFFHWYLEFPDLFEPTGKDDLPGAGGFDVVLGNPPWERIKLQEQEFFETRDMEIAKAPNKAARERLIKKLPEQNPNLWQEFQEAKHFAEAQSKFLRNSERFPLTARGDINTYAVFAELARRLLNPRGRAGIIVPTGIATDDTNKQFFAKLVEEKWLASLFDFENREGLFPAVDSRMKFCLLTISKKPVQQGIFSFFCTNTNHLQHKERVFPLSSEDFQRFNPNTKTCPIFRTKADAELTCRIYERVPVLVSENANEDPWNVKFMTMFHMANDSRLFATERRENYMPLYEAKFLHQFDHRWATYKAEKVRDCSLSEKQGTDFSISARYWVHKDNVHRFFPNRGTKGWLVGIRAICRSNDERTTIASILPLSGVGHSIMLAFVTANPLRGTPLFLANYNSLVFDYVTRQKYNTAYMSQFILKQLPFLPPSYYTLPDLAIIVPRVLELVYTSWDIKPFADDLWRDADEPLRAIIHEQHVENRTATGGHEWKLPDWIEAYPEIETDPKKGIPLPPFKWDEDRRAFLRAELDAYYAKLYGLTYDELRYVLDPQDVYGPDFPGETFRVLKEKEIARYGEYRTKRLVLQAWDRLHMRVHAHQTPSSQTS